MTNKLNVASATSNESLYFVFSKNPRYLNKTPKINFGKNPEITFGLVTAQNVPYKAANLERNHNFRGHFAFSRFLIPKINKQNSYNG